MTSFKSKFFNFMMRNRHLLEGKLNKEVFDENTSIKKFRDKCERGAAKYGKLPKGIVIREDNLDGIKAEWLIPEGSDPAKLILYVHGGGYVSGSCNDHRGFVARFASRAGLICVTYEYRLAPEHSFPAAIDDSVKVYQILLASGFQPGNLLIAGESAGGGLTLALLLALKKQQIALPVAAVAISPWTDLTCSGESYKTKNKVSVAPINSWFVFSKYYVGNQQADNPLISPLFGDLKGLPPLFINSAVNDELFSDGEQFSKKAKEAGVDVTFRAGKGMVHCYPLLAPFFPEATEAMDEIIRFIRAKLN